MGLPIRDIEHVVESSLVLEVLSKEGCGAAWTTVREVVGDLPLALEEARRIDTYEAAVFVKTEHGGFMYWSSRTPDLFSSEVLQEGCKRS